MHARTHGDRVTRTVMSKRTNRPQIREPRADAILPDFQLTYCQDEWEAERASWCMVIQLNLVRGINFILDLLAEELAGGPYPASADSDVSDDDNDNDNYDGARFSPSTGALHLSGKHRLLKLRLAPLRTLQRDLEMRIGIQAGADLSDTMISPPGSPTMGPGAAPPRKQEFFVRSSTSWKQVHGRTSSEGTLGLGAGAGGGGRRSKDVQMREAADILAGCADDMKAIWEDAAVREMLLRKGIRMETTPGLCVPVMPPVASAHAHFLLTRTRTQLLERY